MENKKEPLMSAEEWLKFKYEYYKPSLRECLDSQDYANYVAKWHLNNAKEFVADEVKILDYTVLENWIDLATPSVDKQSIHTAIDNYIKDNLNKEL